MAVFPDTWPSGDVPYLFGASFTQFINDKYGREKLADLSLTYSGRAFPFLVDSSGRRALRTGYARLYQEWRSVLADKFRKESDAVTARGLTVSTALTRKGYETLSPVYSPDGLRIAYFESNNDEFPGIYLMNADGSGDRKVTDTFLPATATGQRLAWSSDGNRLYYTRIDVVRNTNLYDDIYYHDAGKGKEVRVTYRVRARDPHPSPDGSKLLFVVNRMGKTRLAVLDLAAGKRLPAGEGDIAYLTPDGPFQYESPRWSPDGSRIAVSAWQPGGSKDIWVLDGQGRKLEAVTADRAIDGSPAWSPDGSLLYFSSDRSGIFNLYAYELSSRKLSQVTNVLGGAFLPSPSPDNKSLLFTGYSAKGYDVQTMPVDQASWKAAEPYRDVFPAVQYEVRSLQTSTRSYDPLPTLAPRFWLPWFDYSYESGTLAGFLTMGQDVVQRHSYAMTGLYGPKRDRLWYSLDYLYDGLYPTIHLFASDRDETYGNLLVDRFLEQWDYVERQQAFGLEFILPLVKARRQHALSIGYQWKELSAMSQIFPSPEKPWALYLPTLPFEGVLASGRASYLFNNAQRYRFSISPESGRTIELGYERFDDSIGSDLELNKYTADWHEYINGPWQHHVLQVRGFAGSSTGQRFPQGAFQLGGDMPGDVTLSLSDHTVYLRGYPSAEFRGRKVGLLSLEYRLPLANFEGGWGPFFLRRLHGALFGEAGNAWNAGGLHASDIKRSLGAEARLDLDFAYGWVPLTLRLGIAKGLDKEGVWQVIWNAWVPLGF
jgi:WD40 repeat protein